jgi:large repetitive protein
MVRRSYRLLAVAAACLACEAGSPTVIDAPAAVRAGTPGAAVARPARPGNLNALAERRSGARPRAAVRGAAHVDERLGVPTFLWAEPRNAGLAVAAKALARPPASAADAARGHLRARADAYGLSASDVDTADVSHVHDTGTGPVIVKLRHRVAGIQVFREEAAVALDRGWNLVAISGSLSPAGAAPPAARQAFALPAADAVAAALSDLTGEAFAAADLAARPAGGGYATFALGDAVAAARAEAFSRPARAKQVWFRLPAGLEPAWYLELGLARAGSVDALEYGYVVSAADGRVLFRKDQVAADVYTYRVWADPATLLPQDGPQGAAGTPHPAGVPDGYHPALLAQSDVTLANAPFAANDPWLAPGATETTGNNVDAYADLSAPDGFSSGDLRGAISAPDEFRYGYDFGLDPVGSAAQRQAAVTQLFYDVNFLHDWYYDAGFDEAAGNAQLDDYGRGGLGGDPIHAEAQDSSGHDNANMFTPADGAPPRMQMFLFSGNGSRAVRVSAPPALAQLDFSGEGVPGADHAAAPTTLGPRAFSLTRELVLADDGDASAGGGGTTSDGCTTTPGAAWANGGEVAGKIVLVLRGACTADVKATNARANGAAGLVIANTLETQTLSNAAGVTTGDAVPTLLVLKRLGDPLRAALAAGETVSVTLDREDLPRRDGALDATVVAHEWGHYISNRLVHDAAGLDNNQGGALGEGWGDVHALLLAVRPEDALIPGNEAFGGTYAMGGYVLGGLSWWGDPNDAFYFGVRRVPYSTDLAKDPLTLKHWATGNPITGPAPVAFGADGAENAEVHNAGEVWATMLWECYAALLADGRQPFEADRERFKQYLVAAYQLTPASPTLLEARDALLAVAKATDPADWKLFWRAFAKRGAGAGAVGPDRWSTSHGPVIESYVAGRVLVAVDASFGAVESACDDADGVLDEGETGTLTVTLRNAGTEPVAAGTATLTSSDVALGFPAGNAASFPASAPGEAVTLQVKVSLSGAAPGAVMPVALAFDAAIAEVPTALALRTGVDELPQATATETFEARHLGWDASFDAALSDGASGWTRFTVGPGTHLAHAPDLGGSASDLRLTSPPLAVTGDLTLTFRHRHDFEPLDPLANAYDGGVVELSTDWGQTWIDVGGTYGPSGRDLYAPSGNPLEGRRAFTARNPSWPGLDAVMLPLGTGYAGKTVLLRFRAGSDLFGGGEGWYVDDVTVTGLAAPPFQAVVADRRLCQDRAPSADAGAPQTVDEGSSAALDGRASRDPEGKALAFQWTQVAGPAVSLAGADAAQPSFTAPQVTGDAVLAFRLDVSDGGLSSSATTVVTVRDVSQDAPPVASAVGPAQADEGALVVLDATGSSDPEGRPLAYAWTQTGGAPAVGLAGAASAQASFLAPAVAADTTLAFQVSVSDGTAARTATVSVTVRDVNHAPVARAGVDLTVDERSEAALDASGSTDPDGDALSYAWAQVSGPAATLADPTQAVQLLTVPDVAGAADLVFRVTVSDPGGASSTASVTLHARDVNRAPVARAGDAQAVGERTAVALDASASSDPDGDALAFEWAQLAGPAAALSSATAAAPTFTAPAVTVDTDLVFQVTARDGAAASTATVRVTIRNVDPPPSGGGGGGGCSTGGGAASSWLVAGLGLALLRRRRAA